MGVTKRTEISIRLAILAAGALGLIAACYGMWGGPVATPTGLTASTDSESSVELMWSPVDGAGRYHVYRSNSEDGTYEQVAVSGYTGWLDADVEPDRPYWYKVSATDFYGDNESVLSAWVRGITYEYTWEEPSTVAADAVTGSRLAADGSALWATYAAGTDIVLLRNENDPDDDDDAWREIGRVASEWYGVSAADIALSGGDDPVVLFCGANSELTAKRWNSTDDEWEDLGTPTTGNYQNGTAQLLASDDTVYVGWMSAGAPVVKRQVEPGKWQTVDNPDFSDLSTPAPQIRAFRLLDFGGDLSMSVLTGPDPGGEQLGVYLRSAGGWTAVEYLPTQFGPGTFANDGFHVSSGGTFGGALMDISFYDSDAILLRIWQYDGEVWTDLTGSDRAGANLVLKAYQAGDGLPVVARTGGRLIVTGNSTGALIFQQRRSATEQDRTEDWWADVGNVWSLQPSEISQLSLSWVGDALYVQYMRAGVLTEQRYR